MNSLAANWYNMNTKINAMTLDQLENALRFRTSMFDERHQTAFRLFNGFTEGAADITIDVYAKSLVIQSPSAPGNESVEIAQRFLLERLPWIQAIIVKDRTSQDKQRRRGTIVYGETWDRKILEDATPVAIFPCAVNSPLAWSKTPAQAKPNQRDDYRKALGAAADPPGQLAR